MFIVIIINFPRWPILILWTQPVTIVIVVDQNNHFHQLYDPYPHDHPSHVDDDVHDQPNDHDVHVNDVAHPIRESSSIGSLTSRPSAPSRYSILIINTIMMRMRMITRTIRMMMRMMITVMMKKMRAANLNAVGVHKVCHCCLLL